MIKKKISMLGSFAVGKTSLVQQYVHSIFSDKYHTTIGVKVDQKIVRLENREINLMLWDIHGEDDYQKVKQAYVMGSSGYFIVIDGTRRNTLEKGLELQKMAQKVSENAPFIVLVNKADLHEEWEVTGQDIQKLEQLGMTVMKTSAKTGEQVEAAFDRLTRMMMKNDL